MDTGADLQSALREAVNADAQSQAFENIKRVALLGLGVGATARAGVGLAGMLRRNLVGTRDPRSSSPVVPFPYPIRPSEDPQRRQSKTAEFPIATLISSLNLAGPGMAAGGLAGWVRGALDGDPVGGIHRGLMQGAGTGAGAGLGIALGHEAGDRLDLLPGGMAAARVAGSGLGGLLGYLASRRMSDAVYGRKKGKPAETKTAGILEYAQDLASGNKARTPSGVPWEMGGSILAGVGTLAGGWMAVDKMLNARRKKEREQALRASRDDFHDALMSMYAKPYGASRPKVAELVEGLNGLYDRLVGFEKAADGEGGGPFSEGLGRLANVYGGYAALSGLVAGGLIYDHARKGQRRRLLDKALKLRQRQQFEISPPPLVGIPEPVAIPSQTKSLSPDEVASIMRPAA